LPKKIRAVFPIIGAENLSVQALTANLRKNGHYTHMVFDPALFDDKNFLTYSWLEKLFSQKEKVVQEIIKLKPDLIAFSVMTPTFQWANEISARLKKVIPDVPIIFGGVHPTLLPEKCLKNSNADVICVGEGDEAIVELADSIAENKKKYDIPNLWFKVNGGIFENTQRPIIPDLDILSNYDKEGFDSYREPKNNLLIVFSRGCPFNCSFCSLYKYAEDADNQNVERVRLRSPQLAIRELKELKQKYNPKWIEFKDNTFTANKKWLREFLPALKKEINLPFKCFVHPGTLNEEIVRLLKDSGCWGVQIGIESLSESVRNNILDRKESDVVIERAFRLMDMVELPYSVDYILGLPKETETDLLRAAGILIDLKSCHRVSPFLLAYLPQHPITKTAHELGILTDEDIETLEAGGHDHYLSYGSISKGENLKSLLAFKYFFRLIPHLPKSMNRFILKTKLFKSFPYIPFFGELVVGLDVIIALLINEPDIRSYIKHYLWTASRILFGNYYPKNIIPPATSENPTQTKDLPSLTSV
jgi:anaerobic magnesium-protoporphyrin IX monomethyl ester cyclase